MKSSRTGNVLIVIIAEGLTSAEVWKGKTLRQKWRIFRRHPVAVWWLLGAWWVRFALRSKHIHAMVSDGQVVVDRQFTAPRYWAYEDFVTK